MRRKFPLCTPTLLLCLGAQIVVSFLWLLATAEQSLAMTPAVTTSIIGNTVTGSVSTQVVPPPANGKIYGIQGGQTVGSNLFHSFSRFNIGPGDIAQFQTSNLSPNAGISNILGRVNGQQSPSQIFGTIDSATYYPAANLFLMNPYGFLFGPTATVNVGGMVAFTSADYLRLEGAGGSGTFYADASKGSILTSSPVAAFGFLGSNPGAITVQGSQLSVTPAQSISLVGGNITIQSGTLDNGTIQPARLSAPNGQINLAAAASPGEFLFSGLQAGGIQAFAVTPQTLTSLARPNVNGTSFTSFGLVHLAKGSTVDTSQTGNSQASIRGGQFVMDVQDAMLSTSTATPPPSGQNNILISPGSSIVGATLSADRGPDVQIIADTINVSGTPPGPRPPNFAFIKTLTDASGNAGNIGLTATQNIDVAAALIQSSSSPASPTAPTPSGNSGNITLTSTERNIALTNFTQVSPQTSLSTGNTGNITLSAPHGDILLDSAALFSRIQGPTGFVGGNGGGIQITANNLTLRHSASPPAGISIDNFNPQVPGNITVNLFGNLTLDGQSFIQTVARGPALAAADLNITAHNVNVSNGSSLNTQTISSGKAGELNIFTDNLELTNGGQLRSNSVSGPDAAVIGRFTSPTGAAGAINVQGPSGPAISVSIDGNGSGILTNTAGTGAGGNIFVNTHAVTLQNGGSLLASTTGAGNAGNVYVSADSVSITTSAKITGSSSIRLTAANPGEVVPPLSGNAGNVTIQGLASPVQSVLIDGVGSGVFTNTQGTGAGGNILVNGNSVTVQNGGQLSAATSGTAPSATGGTITVNANTVTLASGGTMTAASSGPGASGEVVVQGLASPVQFILIDGTGSGIFTDTHSTGAGGDIHLSSNSVTLQNGGMLSATTFGTSPSAIGGSITVNATDGVTMMNGGLITASSTGPGNAGNISINAGQQLQMQNSSIKTEAAQAGGGNINIQAVNLLNMGNSEISTSVLGGGGSGGNINIDPNAVILQNSQILAQAVQGAGGNISISTNLLLPDTASVISASSQFGQQGTITIQSPISPASGKILPLSNQPLIATSLTNQRCAALAGGNFSSFTVAGRDSLPAEPGGWLSTPLALASSERGGGTLTKFGSSLSEGDSGEETPLLSLRQIAPPGFLTQTFAVESSAGCTS